MFCSSAPLNTFIPIFLCSFLFQDLLLLDEVLDERNSELEQLETSHYVYPVDMASVLTNDAMRDVICRNF